MTDPLETLDDLFVSAMDAYRKLGLHWKSAMKGMPPGDAHKRLLALYERGRSLGLSMQLLDKDLTVYRETQTKESEASK